MIRYQCALSNLSQAALDFVTMIECAALELVRVCLIDASMNKYKPSVVAAAVVFAGFQTQFEVMLEKPSLREML